MTALHLRADRSFDVLPKRDPLTDGCASALPRTGVERVHLRARIVSPNTTTPLGVPRLAAAVRWALFRRPETDEDRAPASGVAPTPDGVLVALGLRGPNLVLAAPGGTVALPPSRELRVRFPGPAGDGWDFDAADPPPALAWLTRHFGGGGAMRFHERALVTGAFVRLTAAVRPAPPGAPTSHVVECTGFPATIDVD